MARVLPVLALIAALIALPFVLRPAAERSDWRPGDPVVTVITPHNEAIRREFGRAFSAWHLARHGRPARVEWVVIGGTSEIARFLPAEFAGAVRAWWRRRGREWPAGAAGAIVARRRPDAAAAPALAELWDAFRATDAAGAFTSGVDVFFGGGEYDHRKAAEQGLSVRPWEGAAPAGLFRDARGRVLVPERVSGETWRGETYFGNALSAFGITFNRDRLRALGLEEPRGWADLTDPRYFGRLGLADPTKSGSTAKAFENMIHERMRESLRAHGFDAAAEERLEGRMAAGAGPGEDPELRRYQETLARGWAAGVHRVQLLGANARYFTASSQRVPYEVGAGETAAGVTIDFYGRFQAQFTARAEERMGFVAPPGGTSVSCDPVSLLRGAPQREAAVRFVEFVLGEAGQRLWCYRPGAEGGPRDYALRRLPIRADFYPSQAAVFGDAWREHAPHTVDDLGAAGVDAYELAATFVYRPRWTAAHFQAHRDLVRAMCLDAGVELRAAWRAILRHGGPEAQPEAMAQLRRLPDHPRPLTWESAPAVVREHPRHEYLRAWTAFFRASYARARALARGEGRG